MAKKDKGDSGFSWSKVVKEVGDTVFADVGELAGNKGELIDTGSYALNALLSADLFGGMVDNKVVGIAGDEATGKSYLLYDIMRYFLDKHPGSAGLLYDTEGACGKETLVARGIDPSRIIIYEPVTVQEFRTHLSKFLEAYNEYSSDERPKFMVGLDSLGNLSTNKEVTDITSGDDKRDMTRAQLIRGAFRALTLPLAKAHIPMFVTNHTYAVQGSYVPTKEMGGGGGLKYAASQIIFLSKSREKDEVTKQVTGNIVRVKLTKSRFTRDGQEVKIRIGHDIGLDRWYGVLDLALELGVVKKEKISGRNMIVFGPDRIVAVDDVGPVQLEPILPALNAKVKERFSYGGGAPAEEVGETDEA